MRVVCINDRWKQLDWMIANNDYVPKIGDEFTVTQTTRFMNLDYYQFKETGDANYTTYNFAPLDGQPEDAEFELVENDTANQR